MLRRSVITALLAATLAAPAAAAPIRGQTLMPGVVYSRQVEFTGHGPVVLNVVSAPRAQGLYAVRTALSNGAVQGRERLTDMEKAISDRTTVVGINGDFFDTRWGTPSSVVVRGGALAAGSFGGRSAAGFDAAGGLHVDRVTFDGSWKGTGQYRPLTLNAPPGRSAVTLYTPAWGAATPPESGTTEVVLAPFPATTPNVTLAAPATQVLQGGGQAIPANGAVLVARGRQAQTLTAEAPAGSTVSFRLILTPRWDDVREAVGGGPVLVRNGRPVFRPNETFSASQLFSRTARGAVGQMSDALFFQYDGVYTPALPVTVATGKVQTLVYKVVRRSTVKATLTGAAGTTTLDARTRDPGTYRFDWTAATAGRWTFDVDAVDDLGRASSSERTFTVGALSTRR
jgi:hypothetical protein